MQKVSLRTRVLRSAESKGVIEGGIEKKKEKKSCHRPTSIKAYMQRGINELVGWRKGNQKTKMKGCNRAAVCQFARDLEDDTLRARATTTNGLDIQGNLGSFIEAFPNSTVLHRGTFCNQLYQPCPLPCRNTDHVPKYLTAPISFAFARP